MSNCCGQSPSGSPSLPAGRATLALLLVLAAGALVAAPAAAGDSAVAVDASASPAQPTVGENATVAVEVANLLADGDPVTVERIAIHDGPSTDDPALETFTSNVVLGADQARTWRTNASYDTPGERTLLVSARIDVGGARPVTIERHVNVTVVDPHPALALSTDPVSPAGRTTARLTVANGRQSALSGLEAVLSAPGLTVDERRRVVSSLEAGAATTLTFPVTDATPGETAFRVRLSYTDPEGELRRVTRTIDTRVSAVRNPANVTLTGVRVEQEGRTLVVRGSASNPGGSNASGVVLRTRDGEHVRPGDQQASFFVGDVRASDFASFELHARLTSTVNRTIQIPVGVEYAVDGERVTKRLTVRYRPGSGETPSTSGGGGGPGLVLVLLVVLLAVAGVIGWRRYG